MHTEIVRANQRHENRGRAGPANRGSQSTQFQLQACRGPTVTKMAVYQSTNGRRDPSCVVCSTAVELIHSTLPVYRNACRHAYALRRLQTYRSTIRITTHMWQHGWRMGWRTMIGIEEPGWLGTQRVRGTASRKERCPTHSEKDPTA